MRIRTTFLTAFITLLFVPCIAQAQDCQSRSVTTQDYNRFDINANGTVTDIESGLTWSRCMAGQYWEDNTCKGSARLLTWYEAQQFSQQSLQSLIKLSDEQSDIRTWRLPRLNELAGIVDVRCFAPRIDLRLFPSTPSEGFWTSNTAPSTTQAYVLNFGRQGVGSATKTERHYVRLVQGRD